MGYEGLLIHRCYLGMKTTSENSLGEIIESWVYSTTPTKCRMVPITAAERLNSPGKFDDVSFRAFFLSDANVNAGDRLKYNDKEYLIKSAYHDSSSHHLTALLMEL